VRPVQVGDAHRREWRGHSQGDTAAITTGIVLQYANGCPRTRGLDRRITRRPRPSYTGALRQRSAVWPKRKHAAVRAIRTDAPSSPSRRKRRRCQHPRKVPPAPILEQTVASEPETPRRHLPPFRGLWGRAGSITVVEDPQRARTQYGTRRGLVRGRSETSMHPRPTAGGQ